MSKQNVQSSNLNTTVNNKSEYKIEYLIAGLERGADMKERL